MNPNHYLAMTVRYADAPAAVVDDGSSGEDAGEQWLDPSSRTWFRAYAAGSPGRIEMFTPGLLDARVVSAARGARGPVFSAGTVWTTDKDGPLLGWLSAGITARTGKDPGERYGELANQFGTPYYIRIDAPETPDQKTRLGKLSPENAPVTKLPGEPLIHHYVRPQCTAIVRSPRPA